jgi:putative transposase
MCPACKRYFLPNAIVFLTMTTAGRRPLFENPVLVSSALETLKNVKTLYPFHMKAYAAMPDHWHLLIQTADGRFDQIIHSFKRNVSFEFKKQGFGKGRIWQNRFYDHIIRDETDLHRHMDYIHFNPVHHGYAVRPMDYRFSSFHHYVNRRWYRSDWGNIIPENIKDMSLS